MNMNIDEFFKLCATLPGRTFEPDDYQKSIIAYGEGPMWVLAGPGSGKTDSMALRCLKLLIIDKVNPKSIIVTTFTEKAAMNIKNRITNYMEHMKVKDPSLGPIDYTSVRIGTLHSLCSDIMHEFRHKEFQNVRMLDEKEQLLFILEHMELSRIIDKDHPITPEERHFWSHFSYLSKFNKAVNSKISQNGNPSTLHRAEIAQELFNRIAEDRIDVNLLEKAGSHWKTLANWYKEYRKKSSDFYRTDFADVQVKFLNFLDSSQSNLFFNGDGTDDFPGVNYVLVDEYQDTNPIQEEIYIRLAQNGKHNLCVVGDDDQALYRFRGGTVECMIQFPAVVAHKWPEAKVEKFDLPVNYRSHPKIVEYCDEYIKSFKQMNLPGARAQGKLALKPGSPINGEYPAVAIHIGKTLEDAAKDISNLIKELKDNGKITDFNQCAILLKSTRESPRNAKPYVEALSNLGIPYYNPRSKALLEQEEVKVLLGTFVNIIDPNRIVLNSIFYLPGVRETVNSWVDAAAPYMNGKLADYVDESKARIRMWARSSGLPVNILDILYHILAHEPFSTWLNDAMRAVRIGVITQIFDAYLSVPSSFEYKPELGPMMMGNIYTSKLESDGISRTWTRKFYSSLIAISSSRGVDEPESLEEDFPAGRVPLMTIHQAKGLEFPFTFLGSLGEKTRENAQLILEDEIRQFSKRAFPDSTVLSLEDKKVQDIVRLFYVAKSRAQNALILVASNNEIKNAKLGIGFGGKGMNWLSNYANLI